MPTSDQLLLLLPLIFLVAALYSSVGHGGASGYLAVISLLGFAAKSFVPIVLTLNVLVASISFLHYRRPGAFKFGRLLPFVVTSIPASYFGGMWKVSDASFGIILGIALLAAAVRLILGSGFRGITKDHDRDELQRITPIRNSQFGQPWLPVIRNSPWAIGLPTGLILGFVSGMIGIGGGVFLSPVLLFLGITDIKGSAAMASAFIVLNSLAGLVGHASIVGDARSFSMLQALSMVLPCWHSSVALIAAGITGAIVGSRWGASRTEPRTLQYALASVLAAASVKLVLSAMM